MKTLRPIPPSTTRRMMTRSYHDSPRQQRLWGAKRLDPLPLSMLMMRSDATPLKGEEKTRPCLHACWSSWQPHGPLQFDFQSRRSCILVFKGV